MITTSNKLAIFNLVSFTLALASFGLLFFILPKASVSELEKRPLAQIPQFTWEQFWSGKYLDSIDLYVADNFPARERWVGLAFGIKAWRGWQSEEIGFYNQTVDLDLGTDQMQDSSNMVQDSMLNAFNEGDPDEVKNLNKGLLIYEGMAIQIFGGSSKSAEYAAKIINEYDEKLAGRLNLFLGITPTHGEFYLPSKYNAVSESKNIEMVYNKVNPNVKTFDVFTELYRHKDQYIFFNTDHHWTGLGAYYAYVAFCKKAGFQALGLEQMERRVIRNFLGSLYRMTQDPRLKEKGDSVVYHKIPLPNKAYQLTGTGYKNRIATSLYADRASGANSYSVYLGSDHPLMLIETELLNGRRAILVKNSFGNALAPYLVSHFEKLYILDYRYFNGNIIDFIERNQITDLIIFHNSFSVNTYSHMNMIKSLLYRKYTPTTEPKDSNKTDSVKTKKDAKKTSKSDSLSKNTPTIIEPKRDSL
jgi:hypothetical protein